jgi:pimeloyl-ACP methyl ester carboxylesterase
VSAPKSLRIRSHKIEIAVLDYGNEGAPPLVLLHGMRDLAWSLDVVARHFRSRARVLAFDLRGHGESDHVGYYAMPHFVIDLRQVIRGLGLERPLLVGHSFGGEVVAQYAGLFPEVPRACVLIEGIGPPPFEAEGSREAGMFWARSAIEALDSLDPRGRRVRDLDEAVQRIRATHPRLAPARARLLAEAGTRAEPDGGLRWKWDPFLRTSWGGFNFRHMEELWAQIRCPVLAVNGAESHTWWRRDVGRLAGRGGSYTGYLPQAELERRLACFRDVECVEIPGAGHMVHFDEPERLCEALDAFVARRGLL